jgi:hypothetical protein
MAFPVPSATTSASSATATATVTEGAKKAAAFNPAAATTPAPAKATTAKTKTAKTDLGQLLNTLKLRLTQNEAIRTAGEPKDLSMSTITRIAPELSDGMAQVLEHFSFDFDEDSNGLRFLPEGLRDDGSTRPAALYFLSLAASGEGDGVALRWGDLTREYSDEQIYSTGIRILGKEAVLNTPTLTCPIGLLIKGGLTEDEQKRMALAGTFSELSEYLRVSAGGGIISDLPENFLMLFASAEERTSKKGNKYTLLHGTQLSPEDSTPMGEVSIFAPGGKDAQYWAGYAGKCVLQYDNETKEVNLLNAGTGEPIGSIAILPKTLKLRELEIEVLYDWVGCELVTFKQSKGWVIKVRKQGTGNTVQCYTNRQIEGVIESGAAMILTAAGMPTDNLDAIFKVDSPYPFGTIRVRNHKPYGDGKVSVDVECLINKSDSAQAEEDALFAELGLI